MFKNHEDQVAVLGICVDQPMQGAQSARMNYHAAHSARRAVDVLRMLSFDFVLVNVKMPDVSTWDFLRQLKTAWPQQKWALVGGPLTEQQEVTARMFGATTIFDATPGTDEIMNLTARLREKAIRNVLAGRFDKAELPSPRAATRRIKSAI